MVKIQPLIERLLGRKLLKTEGVKPSEIDKIEIKFNIKLPTVLRDLYLLAGKNILLLESFNRFALPNQLVIDDNKVIFLEENQQVCYWGFETGNDNPKVYQLLNENEWYEEQVTLNDFLPIILYYQCSQGGYECNGVSNITEEDLEIFINTEWEEVVHYNGLRVYWKSDCLLWYIYDEENKRIDDLYFSARTLEAYDANKQKYELEEI